MLADDSLCLAGLDPRAGLLADFSGFEYFFHGCPIRFDPASIMAAIPVRRDSNLCEFEFRPVRNSSEVEDRNGIMIGPPPGSAMLEQFSLQA